MKIGPALIALATVLLAWSVKVNAADQAQPPNTLTDAEKKAGWKLLFDGKTTTGWRGYKMDKMPPGWAVIDGVLVRVKGGEGGKGAGGGDDIVTTEEFENFDLQLEWKTVPNGNSGVLYHVSEEPVTAWHYAPEVQILDNTAHPTRDKRQLAAACYDLYAPTKDMTKPLGQWNQMRILVDGAHVEHWLNGEKVVEYELWSDDWKQRVAKSKHKDRPKFGTFKKGPIALQDHTDRLEFRNIKIRVLAARVEGASNPRTGDYFPPPESHGGWRKLDDVDAIRSVAGMNPDKLVELKTWLLESDQRNFAAVVIRRGHIVLEVERGNSAKTDARRVASVSKAVCATVLAIASELSQQGKTPRKMTFDDLAFQFIPWAEPLSDPRKAKITVKQLLNHTSGISPEATGSRNEGSWEYILGHTGDERTARLAFDPGTGCGYSSHALYHAALVCETVTGKPYDEFAIEALFKPLGIEHWWFQFFDGDAKHGRHASHGLGMPARDLARIGYCLTRGGRWGERQIVPKWFVDETAAPTHNVTGPEMRFKLNSQSFSHGWELPARLTGEGGRSGAGIPLDARYKPGSGGQLLAFVPSLDLVIARQTGSSGEWAYDEFLRRACAAILADATGQVSPIEKKQL